MCVHERQAERTRWINLNTRESIIRSNGQCTGEVKKRVQAEWIGEDKCDRIISESEQEGLTHGSETCNVWFGDSALTK